MRISHAKFLSGFALCALALAAQDQEKKVKRSDLPAAVEKTVVAESQGATIKGFNEEKENGKIFYEAELIVNGHTRDVLIEPSGGIAEIEEEVSLISLPPDVQSGLLAKAGGARLGKVESLIKHNKLVAYESTVMVKGKSKEIQVGPDGKPLDHEE